MDHTPSNQHARSPPSTISRSSLPRLRTPSQARQTTSQQPQSVSSPLQPLSPPTTPMRIPPEKMKRALKLYEIWKRAKAAEDRAKELAQGMDIEQPAPRLGAQPRLGLNIPPSPTARSPTSPTSSWKRGTSVTSSVYDGLTESVMGFPDNESMSSEMVNGAAEFTSHTGEKVKAPRIRGKLSPVGRPWAALVRLLGACDTCRARRVKCEDHVPVDTLEIELQRRNRRRSLQQRSRGNQQGQTPVPQHLPQADHWVMSPLPQQGAIFNSADQMSKSFEQQGIGMGGQFDQIPQALPGSGLTDSQYPIGDPMDATVASGFPNFDLGLEETGLNFPESEQGTGHLIPLGTLKQYLTGFAWACQYTEGYCEQKFEDEEQLQCHYETHTAFIRLSKPHRWVCPDCGTINEIPTALCTTGQCMGTPETRIYGRCKHSPINQQMAPEDYDDIFNVDFWQSESPNNPQFMFTSPSRANTMGNLMDMGGGNGYNGTTYGGSSNGYYFSQESSTPQGPSPQSGSFDAYGNQPQNYTYEGT